jgi:hypothetical protein
VKKIILVMSAVLLLLVSACVPAFAANDSGSITVEMINQTDDKPVKGKTAVAVKVADAAIENGSAEFTLTEDFSSTDVSLSDTDAASVLYSAVKASGVATQKATSGSDGKALLKNIPVGAYLIYSQEDIFTPFLAFVPYDTGDSLAFDVTAQPKIDIPAEEDPTEPVTGEDPTEPPTAPEETTVKGGSTYIVPPQTPGTVSGGGSSNTPKPHIDPPDMRGNTGKQSSEQTTPEKLPQTGMLQYPVPVLGTVGVILFAIGFVIYGEGKKKHKV